MTMFCPPSSDKRNSAETVKQRSDSVRPVEERRSNQPDFSRHVNKLSCWFKQAFDFGGTCRPRNQSKFGISPSIFFRLDWIRLNFFIANVTFSGDVFKIWSFLAVVSKVLKHTKTQI